MTIYKICAAAEWHAALASGTYQGSRDDIRDGFIHFSSPDQVRATARKHFEGQAELVLIAFDADRLGQALQWEASRGGQLFPHLYGSLDPGEALSVRPLPLGADGDHVFPGEVA